ncbi:DUF1642 domain-containing protein [Lactococcus petauri]|uniref:DUF1642 domain-containing protein n=2 Tax=Lactococcus petauri TaxID=1940789 RepID=UPI0027EBD28E|nr:DUF1642 domain-containing protein [Lactococcus petauri]MDQ7119770.1 DUF1642 domain-containing protein [Lactococcus petauri]MDQ7125369.1 DUF1642 domain-containing protein [Lactococcus petauri]MDQ7126348.1 DUF1642 domain-containing protein [Lactococcus petauri]MDQ7128255.1 DUF1642 domain-containing protein [Lactococcus petauri]MDQ7138089.1 DUF1642 domain-containing protein [Lactococcus petauri]
MTKFELPEKPKKTNTSEDFNNLRKAVDELDKFDYAWKTYANKADRRINAANKYIEELERENQRLKADYNNQAESILLMLEEISTLKSQLQQQALPVVPECVADAIAWDEQNDNSIAETLKDIFTANDKDLEEAGLWVKNNPEKYIIARNIGYTVAKEKRYEVVFLEDDTTRQILMENNAGYYFIEEESENYGYWKQDFTEMEIKEINEKFWQLSVPVKDEQIEVEE